MATKTITVELTEQELDDNVIKLFHPTSFKEGVLTFREIEQILLIRGVHASREEVEASLVRLEDQKKIKKSQKIRENYDDLRYSLT